MEGGGKSGLVGVESARGWGERGRVDERVTAVIQTRIRPRCDRLRWHFYLEKHVVLKKGAKQSPRHRRDMNVHSVWSGWTCVACGRRSDVEGGFGGR